MYFEQISRSKRQQLFKSLSCSWFVYASLELFPVPKRQRYNHNGHDLLDSVTFTASTRDRIDSES